MQKEYIDLYTERFIAASEGFTHTSLIQYAEKVERDRLFSFNNKYLKNNTLTPYEFWFDLGGKIEYIKLIIHSGVMVSEITEKTVDPHLNFYIDNSLFKTVIIKTAIPLELGSPMELELKNLDISILARSTLKIEIKLGFKIDVIIIFSFPISHEGGEVYETVSHFENE